MNTIFIDTNVFVRFFVATDKNQHVESKALFTFIESGHIRPYTSTLVLLECYYVLSSIYKMPRKTIQNLFDYIIAIRNLTIVETTYLNEALTLWKQTGIKFTDCLIATQIPKGVGLCTYDMEFKKIPNFVIVSPSQIVKRSVA